MDWTWNHFVWTVLVSALIPIVYRAAWDKRRHSASEERNNENSDSRVPSEESVADFQQALNDVSSASMDSFSDHQRLSLYALYKQATIGKCNTPCPSRLDMVRYAKWNAWQALGGMNKDQAKCKYVSTVKHLLDPTRSCKGPPGERNAAVAFSSMGGAVSTPIVDTQSELWVIQKDVFQYASDGDIVKILDALKSGCNINGRDEEGRTMLHWAVDRSQIDVAKLLIDHKIDVNLQDNEGLTALHYAISCEHEALACLLLEHGALSNIKDNDGETAFAIASESKNMLLLFLEDHEELSLKRK